MRLQGVWCFAVLAVALAACGPDVGRERRPPVDTPTVVARQNPTEIPTGDPDETPLARVATAARATATGTPAGVGRAETAIPTLSRPDVGNTPEMPELAPTPDPFLTEEEAAVRQGEEFAGRLRGAIRALGRLPGYTYTVSDSTFDLALVGQVAAPDRRSWTVHREGAPGRVVGRWVSVGGRSYADTSGRWARVAKAPYDTESGVSFGDAEPGELYPSYAITGRVSISRRDERLGGRAAIQYDFRREVVDMPQAKGSDSLWVARDGGHLLRYEGMIEYGTPEYNRWRIEATPLAAPPDIRPPVLGSPAFEGDPPPWRAETVGRERLLGLEGYRFRFGMAFDGEELTLAEGRVSEGQGRVTGAIPVFEGEGEPVEAELVYIGRRVWGRVEKKPFRRISAEGGDEYPQQAAAALLEFVPTHPDPEAPDGVERLGFGGPSVYGVEVNGSFGIRPMTDARYVGTEVVNGVRALHYRGSILTSVYDYPRQSRMPTDVWIAADGHYLVRSVNRDPPGQGEGALSTDVYDANEPFRVEPPSR